MKTVFISLCIILFLYSCDVADPPATGRCRWGALGALCDVTTSEFCRNLPNGVWYRGEDCSHSH